MWVLALVFVVTFLTWWWFKYARIPENFPKGPYGLPGLGYVPILLAENIVVGFTDLHTKYGPNFSVNLGPGKRLVVIGDYETLKDAFKDDSLAARPPEMNWFNVYFRYGNGYDSRGLIFSHGSEWMEQRRFSLRSLRDFGFGKSSMEELIREEILQFSQFLDKDLDQPINVRNKFNISVINGLWTIIAGKRYNLDDPELMDVVKKVDELTSQSSNTSILSVLPSLRHIAPELTRWNRIISIMTNVTDFVGGIIEQHVDTFKRNPEVQDHPNDFIDAFLAKIKSSPDGSSFSGSLGIQNLRSTILDLLIAGSETTSTALTWSILFMIKYPEIQRRVREEIDQVVGNTRLPEVADRPNLPFTEAVIQEVLRMSCIAPLGLPHYAPKPVNLLGGKIQLPAGTTVMPNIFHIVNNPEVFSKPEVFNPDRFLENGKYVKNEHNIIFSIGKRDCLGKSLALTELYLFFAALMQRYTFRWIDEGHLERLNIKGKIGFTQIPPPYEVIVSRREVVMED